MQDTLVDTSNYNAYAMQVEFSNDDIKYLENRRTFQFGCTYCQPECPDGVRCRSKKPLTQHDNVCDCADIEQFRNKHDGMCVAKNGILNSQFLITIFIFFRNASRSLDCPQQWEHRHSDWHDEGCSEQGKNFYSISDDTECFRSGWKSPYRSLHLTLSRSLNSTRIEKRCSVSCLNKVVCSKSRCIHTKEFMKLLGKVRNFAIFQEKKKLIPEKLGLVRSKSPSVAAPKKNTAWNEIFSQEIRSLRMKILSREPIILFQIDGTHAVVSDLGKAGLNNVSVVAAISKDEEDSVIIHGISKIFAKMNSRDFRLRLGLWVRWTFLLASPFESSSRCKIQVSFSQKIDNFQFDVHSKILPINSGIPSLPKPALWIRHSGRSLSCRPKLVLMMEDKYGRMEMETRLLWTTWQLRHMGESWLMHRTSSNQSNYVSTPPNSLTDSLL